MESPSPSSKKPQPPQLPRPGRLQWLLLLGLLAWNLFLFLPVNAPQADLPYTDFLAQVRADNVKHIQITGSQITGELATAIIWPPAPPVAATGTPAPAAGPFSTQASSQSYTSFNTTFPEAVGDNSLMPLLQTHNVVVDVSEPRPRGSQCC